MHMFWVGLAVGLLMGSMAGAGGLAWLAIRNDRRRLR